MALDLDHVGAALNAARGAAVRELGAAGYDEPLVVVNAIVSPAPGQLFAMGSTASRDDPPSGSRSFLAASLRQSAADLEDAAAADDGDQVGLAVVREVVVRVSVDEAEWLEAAARSAATDHIGRGLGSGPALSALADRIGDSCGPGTAQEGGSA